MSDLERREDTTPDPRSPEFTRRVVQAAGKGQVALLVTDAAGVVIVGLQAIGGLTRLEYKPGDGLWLFEGAISGKPTVLDGSYALRNQLGTEYTPERWEPDPTWTGDDDGRPSEPPLEGYPNEATRRRHRRELRERFPGLGES